jgi:hypothetical protein
MSLPLVSGMLKVMHPWSMPLVSRADGVVVDQW